MSRYKFSTDVSDSIVAAFNSLSNDFSLDHALALANVVLRFLADTHPLEQQIATFCEETGIKPIAARRCAHGLIALFRGSIKRNLDAQEVRSDCVQLGLQQDKSDAFQAAYAQNKDKLLSAAAKSTLTVNQLVDMDWRFGLAASSSSMDKVGSTFLQMKLRLAQEDRPVNVEMTLEQFYSFLGEMEKAEATVIALE